MNARSLIASSFSRGAFVNASFTDAARVDPGCPEGARLIPLTRGYSAIVDEGDYANVSTLKWHAFISSSGHVYARTSRSVTDQTYMHRWLLGAVKGEVVDHKRGNGLDNRRTNLRKASRAGNAQNRTGVRGKVLPKGVFAKRSKFMAVIGVGGKQIYLGTFDDPITAGQAYDIAARSHFGEFARLNYAELRPEDLFTPPRMSVFAASVAQAIQRHLRTPHAPDLASESVACRESTRGIGLPRW